MLSGRPSDLTGEDVQRLVDEQVQESDQIELKEALPSKNNEGDPWERGENQVGDYARNKLIEEVIAFANGHGGWLFLGVRESKDKPPRAAELSPIRDCHDLAERLRLMCRDCIEPQLPVLEIAGIPTGESSEGVVAFYVPRSHAAPHRHKQTFQCYIRRADRTDKMTMREIQDLTLNLERGDAVVRKTLKERREMFKARLASFYEKVEGDQGFFGIRVTAIPVSRVYLERVHNVKALQPPLIPIKAQSCGHSVTLHVAMINSFSAWKPILRGTQGVHVRTGWEVEAELTKHGLVEYKLLTNNSSRACLPSRPMSLAMLYSTSRPATRTRP